MITLYQFGNSVCCQKVRVVLAAKGLAWWPHEIDLAKSEQYDPAYLALNPAGVVPTLVDGDAVVTQSTLICEYLDAVHATPPLLPATPLGRAHARLWSKVVDEGLHEGIAEISFASMFRERVRAMTPAQRDARLASLADPKRRDRFVASYEHGVASRFVVYAVGAYETAFARMEAVLAGGGPWLMGADPTLADIALMPYVARLGWLGLLDLWTAERPHVAAWWARTQAWAPFTAGIAAPLRDGERVEMAASGPPLRPALGAMLAELRA